MIEYKSGERLGYIKKSPHSPECVSSINVNTVNKTGINAPKMFPVEAKVTAIP